MYALRKTPTRILVLALMLALMLGVLAMFGDKPASAQSSSGEPTAGAPSGDEFDNITPTLITQEVDNSVHCDEVGLAGPLNEYKVEPVTDGAHTDGPLTVNLTTKTLTGSEDPVPSPFPGPAFDWTSNLGIDAVIVKGGPGTDTYVYEPPQEATADTNLHAPVNNDPNDPDNGKYYGLSHITFCYDGETVFKPLTATKTADGSYDRNIKWELTKTVDDNYHSGLAGDSFNSIWTVTATKNDEALSNFNVAGDIKITNPNGFPVGFSVSDALSDTTVADVDCSSDAGNQASGTVLANSNATCTYSASPLDKSAESNTADVTSNTLGVGGTSAKADITWNENVKGDEEVTLADERFTYSELISDTTDPSVTFPEKFTCPTDRASYDANRSYTKTFTNIATLKGDNTDKTASATVTLKCTYPWVNETATGFGQDSFGKPLTYPGTSNWFMYTPYTTNKVDLIAGQKYDAGDIYMARTGTTTNPTTTITVTLGSGFRFANVKENLKIQDFAKAPTKYLDPGSFKYKYTLPQSTTTYTATIPGNTAPYYGIHASVERFVP